MADPLDRKLAAILSADVVGYSRLMAEDEATTIRTLLDCREAIATQVRQHRGRVVDAPGDNVLAEFPTALDAVRAAVEAQSALRTLNAGLPAARRMDFRVGVHMGDIATDGDKIYGEGVNIAARLEALAEAGGICISGTLYEQVRKRLDVAFAYLGEQALKNIPHPVRVYRVQPQGGAGEPARGGAPAEPGLPDKPSLAVLPFENLSGDPTQEYFSDGITEDLTNELARDPYVFVIARNSAFAYKGRHVKVQEVGRELGVRYVLEGSARKAEDRVRITAQLIDATTGGHLWSGRYDHDLSDIFALQTEIAEEVFGRVGREIRRAEGRRLARRPTTSLSAWEAHLKGLHHLQRNSVPDNEAARALFARALELDPDFAAAHANLGSTYTAEYINGWNRDPGLLDRAEGLARRAIALDPEQFQGHLAVGWVEFLRGNLTEALAAAERAIALAPNFETPHALRGMALARQGRSPEAAQSIRRALRLSPRAPNIAVLVSASYASFAAGRREEALGFMELARSIAPEDVTVRVALAGFYELEGAHAKAVVEVAEILRLRPDLTAEGARELIPGVERLLSPEELAQLGDLLRTAGIP